VFHDPTAARDRLCRIAVRGVSRPRIAATGRAWDPLGATYPGCGLSAATISAMQIVKLAWIGTRTTRDKETVAFF